MRVPLRGLKGLWWELEDYLEWPSLLAEAGYNFLMVCYTACPETSLRWRRPFSPGQGRLVRRLAAECAARRIQLCLAIHPFIGSQVWTPAGAAVRLHPTSGGDWFRRHWQARRHGSDLQADPPLRYGSAADLRALTDKLGQCLGWGVNAVALCLDDIEAEQAPAGFGGLAEAQCWLASKALSALQSASTLARLLLVPTYYWSQGARAHAAYTQALADGLPPEVDVFWTGEQVRS